eukprot:757767-Hanusia_phi.AAC.6
MPLFAVHVSPANVSASKGPGERVVPAVPQLPAAPGLPPPQLPRPSPTCPVLLPPLVRSPAPQISYEKSRYSIDVRDTETLTERMKERQRSKIEQAAQERRRKEYEELKECTFTPQILRQPPKPSSAPVLVRGLGRHLELRELAQRQVRRRRRGFASLTEEKAEEKAEREKRWVNVSPPARRDACV